MSIRDVSLNDASVLLDIYAPYVLNTAITFETEVPTLTEFQFRIQKISSQYPYLVIEDNGFIMDMPMLLLLMKELLIAIAVNLAFISIQLTEERVMAECSMKLWKKS